MSSRGQISARAKHQENVREHNQMSARGIISARGPGGVPVGTSSRSELFSARENYCEEKSDFAQPDEYDKITSAREKQRVEDYGMGNEEDDPLQLEHILGFSTEYKRTVIALPGEGSRYLKSMGNLVSIENLNDSHDQKLMRGHDMPVCALAVSPSGAYVASGQIGTKAFKGTAAPIFVWSTATGRRFRVLRGLSNLVSSLAFSTDERFICGCADDCLLYIWDLATAEVVYGQRLTSPPTVLMWAEHKKDNHYTSYELVIGMESTLYQAQFSYIPDRVQWKMSMSAYAIAPGGYIRSFTSVDVSRDRNNVYIGTTGGEMMVYRRDTHVFRACIPICSNGVQSLATLINEDIVLGGGDGSVTILSGHDMTWHKIKTISLHSSVKSISLTADTTELIIGCENGTVYRCMSDSLQFDIVSVGHTSPITCTDMGNTNDGGKCTLFVTGTRNGDIKVWDVADYACLAASSWNKSGSVLSLCFVDNSKYVISGWEDGFIRCHDTETLSKVLWYIPSAHRGGVNSLACHVDAKLQYFVSGGADGACRIWRMSNRELVTQYTEHAKAVAKVSIDVISPHIIHSVGICGSVLSFDLKATRRITCHLISSGSLINMTQRKDNELELITCDAQGRLFHWDIDVRDPVLAVQDPSHSAIKVCSVSPSGRYIAFGGEDCLLKVLEINTGQVVSLGQGHSNHITTLVWTQDEAQIITGGEDSCLCIWNFFLGGGEISPVRK